MRPIDEIFIHVADTPDGMDIGVKTIRKWHVEERKFSDIGYHYVLRRSGIWEIGRPIDISGAHAKGHNTNSIGLCIVGRGFNITMEQRKALKEKIKELLQKYPGAKVRGHNEVSTKQWCPGFDVQGWMKENKL